MQEVTVQQLSIYPVKGCGGILVDHMDITGRGIIGDREYSFVGEDGHLICQKKTPVIASIQTELRGGALVLHRADAGSFTLEPSTQGKTLPGTWIADHFEGIDQGDAVAEWASTILGKPARLIRIDQPWKINFPVASLMSVHGKDKQRFNAVSDVSVTNIASLEALNRLLEAPVDMNRFRSNIVVDGIAAYEEDNMEILATDEVAFSQVTPAERCEIITTDQKTGARPKNNLLKMLGKTRYKSQDRYSTGLLFGIYMTVAKPGRLRVGDRLKLQSFDKKI